MPIRKRSVRIGASLPILALALGFSAAPTWAQGTGGEAASSSGSDTGLSDIIVTASRRSENLQKESRAIAAVGAEELARQGVSDAAALQKLVPGLTISRNGPQLQVSIRGVGDRTINAATDPAIAINVDGIYYPKSYQASGSFYDLERIEVLKGPQGTLYGRNASSGAINLIAAKPKFETGGFAEFEAGDYKALRGTAALNLAASDKVAFRLSGQVVDRDGYLTDGYNDEKTWGVRAQVLIAPSTDTSLLVSGFYSHLGGIGTAAVIARRFDGSTTTSPVAPPSNPWAGPTDPAMVARVTATNPTAGPLLKRDAFQDINVYGLSATFEHKMGWATLTLLPSYVESDATSLNRAALVVASFQRTKSSQLSMEARLSSPDASAFKWVVGAFGSRENVNDEAQSRIPIPPGSFVNASVSPRRDDRTWAIFGEANYSLNEQLRLIGGVRYTWEKKIVVGYTGSVFGPIPQFPVYRTDAVFPVTGVTISGDRVDHATNFRVGLEYDVAPQSMLYATVASGFKAGGFYANVAPGNSYKPERLVAYQIGSKNRFLDNRLQVNVEAFYWDYKDKQETFLALLPIGNVLVTQNAGKVTMYGMDASIVGQLSPNDTLSAEAEYLHSKYDSYVYSYTGAADPTINCGTAVSGTTTTRDCSGYPLVRAPMWSGRIAYEHVQSLSGSGSLAFNADMTFSSSYFLSNNFTALSRAKSYQLFNASLTWTSENSRFLVSAFIRNIGNTPVYTGGVQSAALSDAVVGQIAPPRTFGARVRVKF